MDSRDLTPLPRGRHNLTRDAVEASQRLRLIVGLADAMHEQGYADTPVAAILDRAGVSRQTFYQLYENKLACFLDALDLVNDVLEGQLRAGFDSQSGTPLEQAAAALGSYIDTLAENVPFARLYIVEAHAAGTEALARRAAMQERVATAIAVLVGATSPDDRFACDCYVAAASALVTVPVAAGDREAILALRQPLVRQLERLAAAVGGS
ncbi:MAG: TetR/AcrR family transcriptional regulator [Actinomycetota bacterium]|nr:TetR/AcrR family transcriptional regulator [Actinomycetota bacterium]